VADAKAKTNTDANQGGASTIKVRYMKSAIGYSKDQKATVRSLGFTRLYQTLELPDTPAVRGQVFKVKHLVEVLG
jgi:large subunit ribosomal protein L30